MGHMTSWSRRMPNIGACATLDPTHDFIPIHHVLLLPLAWLAAFCHSSSEHHVSRCLLPATEFHLSAGIYSINAIVSSAIRCVYVPRLFYRLYAGLVDLLTGYLWHHSEVRARLDFRLSGAYRFQAFVASWLVSATLFRPGMKTRCVILPNTSRIKVSTFSKLDPPVVRCTRSHISSTAPGEYFVLHISLSTSIFLSSRYSFSGFIHSNSPIHGIFRAYSMPRG